MNHSAIDIERLVREVLTDLGKRGQDVSTHVTLLDTCRERALSRSVVAEHTPGTPQRAFPTVSNTQKPAVAPDNTMTITSRVVTIDSLKDRLDGVRRLCVPRGAVLTPAVRDELRRRNIALEYAEQNNAAIIAARLHIVVAAANYDPAALIEALKRDGVPVNYDVENCLIAAADGLARAISGGDALGLLLTEHTAAALCLLNRLPGVRAATADTAAAAAVGANAMVADPRRTSLFQLKRLAADFLRGGVRECPAVFKERLG